MKPRYSLPFRQVLYEGTKEPSEQHFSAHGKGTYCEDGLDHQFDAGCCSSFHSHWNIPEERFLAGYRGQQAAAVEYCYLRSAFAVPNPGQIQLRNGTIVQWRIRPSLCPESKQRFHFYVVCPNSEYIQKEINCLEQLTSELRKPLVNGTRPMNLVSEDTALPKENR